MRRIVAAVIVLSAVPVFGGGLVVHPAEVTLRVGEQTTLTAADEPGGLSSGFPYKATFYSDDPTVARVSGYASGSGYVKPDPTPYNGEIYVTAIAPGTTYVLAREYEPRFATIVVLGQPTLSLQPAEITTTKGKVVTLTAAITDPPSWLMFTWYQGHIGDESKPLQNSADRVLHITPDFGVTAIWVRAIGGGWMSTAEAKITVPVGRRRAAR